MVPLIVILLALFAFFFYKQFCKPLKHWTNPEVPHDSPLPVVGNILRTVLRVKSFNDILKELYRKYSHNRYFGFYMFSCPSLVICDPDLVKQICIKDFSYFSDHRPFLQKSSDPTVSKLLFARNGRDWHDHRRTLGSAYTQSKMKQMFPMLNECIRRLIHNLPRTKETISVNLHTLIMKFTNDLALNSSFGIECDSFNDSENEYLRIAQKTFVQSKLKVFGFRLAALSSKIAQVIKIKLFNEEGEAFYRKIVNETLTYRRANNITRIDMLHLLNEAQKGRLQYDKDDQEDKQDVGELVTGQGYGEISDDDVAMELMGLFLANFDMYGLLVCNSLYEIALHQDVQEKLFREIDEMWQSCDGNLTYEDFKKMKYLDMVYNECLRFRSPLMALDRCVTKPYTIPPVLPHEKPLHLKPGQDITIPIYCFSRDEKFYENPNKFDPERFSAEHKSSIDPHTFIPFGCGPRMCVAYRLVALQTKFIMFHLLLRFRLVPTEKTIIPFPEGKKHNILSSEQGYWVGLKSRD
ncbi:hypothetical protein PPYR_13833 [Photinus pyralis]|uniref:Cytochrome P450 n=1 Tax=Photinus pyralis TaxID=7054 RepID=A0A1Y1L170_PHOPY|nr:cytochrome P450 9e2-like [Photinus pyralis]KAB0794213.1 hypothetical protein PPYR_13833 [Photinus pyralis]